MCSTSAPITELPALELHAACRPSPCLPSAREQEVTYPQKRLEEEGATVTVIGSHPAGTRYTGKFGYPVVSALAQRRARRRKPS
jgi:hypothetical protein